MQPVTAGFAYMMLLLLVGKLAADSNMFAKGEEAMLPL